MSAAVDPIARATRISMGETAEKFSRYPLTMRVNGRDDGIPAIVDTEGPERVIQRAIVSVKQPASDSN